MIVNSFLFEARRITGAADLLASRTSTTQGIQLRWLNKFLSVGVWSTNKYWLIYYTVPECKSISTNLCNPEVRWLHVAAVWNKVQLFLFINGILDQTDAIAKTSTFSSTSDKIKMANIVLIREVKLWDWALSTDAVKELYESGLSHFYFVLTFTFQELFYPYRVSQKNWALTIFDL